MKPELYSLPIVENEPLGPGRGIWMLKLRSPEISAGAKPGQFLMIRVSPNLDPLLPRPFSLCRIQPEKKSVSVVYKTGGPGTAWLSHRKKGETVAVLGPLGTPFTLPRRAKHVALVAGGIGVTPLIALGEMARREKKEIHFFLGLRDKSSMTITLPMLSFAAQSRRHFTTDNGSFGKKGDIVEHLRIFLASTPVEYIAACGPKPMLRSLQSLVTSLRIPTEAAVEEAMACGLGYCQGCMVEVMENGRREHRLACTQGPILPLEAFVL